MRGGSRRDHVRPSGLLFHGDRRRNTQSIVSKTFCDAYEKLFAGHGGVKSYFGVQDNIRLSTVGTFARSVWRNHVIAVFTSAHFCFYAHATQYKLTLDVQLNSISSTSRVSRDKLAGNTFGTRPRWCPSRPQPASRNSKGSEPVSPSSFSAKI